MSVDQNKQNLRRLFEQGINERNVGLLKELVAEHYVNHNMPAPVPGREGLLQVLESFYVGFPDMRVTVHEVFGEGNLAGTRGTWTGTHQGDFMGIPATGTQVS